jgi:hypothetical protein
MAGCVLVPEIKSLSSWISVEAGTRALSKSGFLPMARGQPSWAR